MMSSRTRAIDLWSCCGRRTVSVTINPDELTDEAWRLARCLFTTDLRRRDNGVRVQALRTRAEYCRSEAELEANVRRVYGDAWANGYPVIDWGFTMAYHIWPDHKNGPHPDPDPELLKLKALAWMQTEATKITQAGGTVIASGDWNVQLLAPHDVAPFTEKLRSVGLELTWGEHLVILPDEQAEARTENALRALFGS